MNLNTKTALCAVFAISVSASAASAVDYKCELKANPGVPPLIYVIEDKGETYAYDGLIDDIYGKPIPAKISVDNDKRVTYSWNVNGAMGKNSNLGNSVNGNINFRLTRQKASGKASLQGKLVGYDNSFRSSGKCTIAK